MRKVQLSFRIEDFRGEKPKQQTGYIDANTYQEVLHDLVQFFFEESGAKDYDEFCSETISFDASKRFGTTNFGGIFC